MIIYNFTYIFPPQHLIVVKTSCMVKKKRKKQPRIWSLLCKGLRLPDSNIFPAREELVGVLLSENPSIQ